MTGQEDIALILGWLKVILGVQTALSIAGFLCIGLVTNCLRKELQKHKNKLDAVLQEQKNVFDLGTASHMANVVFDKHVEFTEKYIKEAEKCLTMLGENGCSGIQHEDIKEITIIRRNYRCWITDDVNAELRSFEKTLTDIVNNSNGEELFRRLHRDNLEHGYPAEYEGGGYRKQADEKWLELMEGKKISEMRKQFNELLDIDSFIKLRKKIIEKYNC